MSHGMAAAKISLENLKDEVKTVLTVRDECALQEGMGMAAGAFNAADLYPVSFWLSFSQIDDIAVVLAMVFESSFGSAGWAFHIGEIRQSCPGIGVLKSRVIEI